MGGVRGLYAVSAWEGSHLQAVSAWAGSHLQAGSAWARSHLQAVGAWARSHLQGPVGGYRMGGVSFTRASQQNTADAKEGEGQKLKGIKGV